MHNPLQVLLGLTEQHLIEVKNKQANLTAQLHSDVVNDFIALQVAAKHAGFDLQIASGFRHFERQVQIWNRKFSGQVPCYDKNGTVHRFESYSDEDKIFAILQFSALPGLSRHHWGTDFDYFDPSLLGSSTLQLSPAEYDAPGVFCELNKWLDANMDQFGFFRPYQEDLGGVAREPWHLSHIETSESLLTDLAGLRSEVLLQALKQYDILGYETIATNIDTIVQQFGLTICPAQS